MNQTLHIFIVLYSLLICEITCKPYVGLDVAGDDFAKSDAMFSRQEQYDEDCDGDDAPRRAPSSRSGDGGTTTEDACGIATELSKREIKAKPVVRKLETKVETDKEQVKENPMETTECVDIEELEPKTSVKIETVTIPVQTFTRKIVYTHRRRKIKKIINHPILVIRRRLVKERQTFERIVPKVIETREIINKPEKIAEQIETDAPEEEIITDPPKPKNDEATTEPFNLSLDDGPHDVWETECEDTIDAVPGFDSPGYPQEGVLPQVHQQPQGPAGQLADEDQPIEVPGWQPNQNGGNGLMPRSTGRGFAQEQRAPPMPGYPSRRRQVRRPLGRGVPPRRRSGGYRRSGGTQLYMVPRMNAYGQPVMSFSNGRK